ncbi:MAG: WG repeat-containing protein [Candidatus Hodarchaeota archaeon]
MVVPAKEDFLYKILESGKYGFMDETGKVIVEPRYGTVRYQHDGVIWVNEGGTKEYSVIHSGGVWGLIDSSGNVLFEPRLQLRDLNDFSEGVAWVKVADQETRDASWGLIDKSGTFILEPEHTFDISEGVTSFHDSVSHVKKDGKIGMVHKDGRFIVEPNVYNYISWLEGNRAWVHVGGIVDAGWWGDGIQSGLWGLIDQEGNIVVKPRFDDHYSFSDGVAWINQGGSRDEPSLLDPSPDCVGGKWGLIDPDGRLILDYKYDEVYNFNEGKALVKDEGIWKIIGKDGTTKVSFNQELDEIHPISDGLLQVTVNGLYGYIDEAGDYVLQPIYEDVKGYKGIAWVKKGGNWQIFNKKNRELVTPETRIEKINTVGEDHSVFIVDGKYGIINTKGKVILEPRFSFAYNFQEGVTWVYEGGYIDGWSGLRGGKWRLVDEAGNFLTPPKYDHMFYFRMPLTEVKAGNEWGYVNRKGEEIWFSSKT